MAKAKKKHNDEYKLCPDCNLPDIFCTCNGISEDKGLEKTKEAIDKITGNSSALRKKMFDYRDAVVVPGRWYLCKSCNGIFIVQEPVLVAVSKPKFCPYCKKPDIEESAGAMVISSFGGD